MYQPHINHIHGNPGNPNIYSPSSATKEVLSGVPLHVVPQLEGLGPRRRVDREVSCHSALREPNPHGGGLFVWSKSWGNMAHSVRESVFIAFAMSRSIHRVTYVNIYIHIFVWMWQYASMIWINQIKLFASGIPDFSISCGWKRRKNWGWTNWTIEFNADLPTPGMVIIGIELE